MRLAELLNENKWWEDQPTVDLYHGTSSVMIDNIRSDGLRFPATDAEELAHQVLREFLPEEEWTDELLDRLQRFLAMREGNLNKDNVIYAFPKPERAAGFAQSYAKHGGEIAHEVWQLVTLHRHPELSWADVLRNSPVTPRFPHATPVLVKVRVPKSWCLISAFDSIPDMAEKLTATWQRNQKLDPAKRSHRYKTLSREDFLDEVTEGVEFRVIHPIPPSMILDISAVSS